MTHHSDRLLRRTQYPKPFLTVPLSSIKKTHILDPKRYPPSQGKVVNHDNIKPDDGNTQTGTTAFGGGL